PGIFSALQDPFGVNNFVLMWNDSVQYWATGVWNDIYFSQLEEIPGTYSAIRFKFDKMYLTYTLSYMEEKTSHGCCVACLNNSSCNAFAVTATATATASRVCRFLFGDLLNIRHSSAIGQYLFIWVAASDHLPTENKNKVDVVSIIVPVCTSLALAFALLITLLTRQRLLQQRKGGKDDDGEMFLRAVTYSKLQIATKNFKHRLGSGGFCSVFKGTVTNGALVAVKKLQGYTRPTEKQFHSKIETVGNI
ncbi:hypothetical protein KI387_037682, partial [Taxus chinensis]